MKTTDKNYVTVKQATEALKGKGYKHLFEMDEDNMLRGEGGVRFPSDRVKLDEMISVNEKDEDKPTSVYALTTGDGAKGYMLDGFGVTGSVHRTNFLEHLTSKRTIRS